MTCDYCGRPMEPTIALAFFHPELRDKADAFPWACRVCRTCSTEPVLHERYPGEEELAEVGATPLYVDTSS